MRISSYQDEFPLKVRRRAVADAAQEEFPNFDKLISQQKTQKEKTHSMKKKSSLVHRFSLRHRKKHV